MYFYFGKNACSIKHTCIRCLSLCRSNRSSAFFVRGFVCALFKLMDYKGALTMKKIISLLLAVVLILSTFSSQIVFAASIHSKSEVGSSEFLSDEIADKFVKLFYSQSTSTAEKMKDILTGKKKGTTDDIKDLYENAISFYDLLDSDTVEAIASKSAANAVNDISRLTEIISGVIDIYDNGKSFVDSNNAMQKTVDAIQMFSSVISVIGYSSYLPPHLALVLASTESVLCLGGYLETAYFKENATLYQYELEIAYQTGEEIPFREAPKITIGSNITQEEADSIYSQLYINYCVKKMLDNVGGASTTYEDMYAWPYEGEITLVDKSVSVDSVRFYCDEYTMFMNQNVNIPANTFPKNAYYGGISSFYSSDSSIINVDSSTGLVRPVNPGVAYIYAVSNNGIKGKCKITVLEYSVSKINNTYTLNKYYGDSNIVRIPSVVEGIKINSVGENCFSSCENLKKIVIPNGVTTIGNYAFSKCTNLAEVTLPNSVTGIGNYAFYNCTSLTSVIIPDSVTEIGSNAFEDCSKLANVTIGNSVTEIGYGAFDSCTSLTSVTIPGSVKYIGCSAFFKCSNLSSITISDGVASIGNSAFLFCTSLTSITIPDSVTEIGGGAFKECTSLSSITIPDSVTSIGNNAFYNCESLASVEIPDGVKIIGEGTFFKCANFTSVTIPNSVTSIGRAAFLGCTNLASVTIGDSVKEIGYDAFNGCTSLTSVTIPNSVTFIDSIAFVGCTNLKCVTIGNSVTTIANSAFRGCTSLTSFKVDNQNQYYCSVEGVLFNKDKTSLITYPSGSTSKAYSIPNSVTRINDGAFLGCTNLVSITIPNSVTGIRSETFRGCTSLASITIPDSVTSIGEGAFSGCTNLTSVTIPNSVTGISYNAFSGCTSLTDVYYAGSEVKWNKINIEEYNNYLKNATIHFNSKGPLSEETIDENTGISVTTNSTAEINVENLTDSDSANNVISLLEKSEKLADLYDISLTKDGVAIQLNEPATVKIPTTNENAKVYRIETDGTKTDMNAVFDNGYMVFTTEHFSLYALVVPNVNVIGDINGDGVISIADATVIQKYLANIIDFEDGQLAAADTNGDGSVSIADATQIQKYLANIVTSLG